MKMSLKVTVYFSCFPPKRRACDGSILFNVNRDDGGGLSPEQLISDQRSTQEHAIVIDDAFKIQNRKQLAQCSIIILTSILTIAFKSFLLLLML